MNMKTSLKALLIAGTMTVSSWTFADDYAFDVQGMHSSVKFRVQHLGYSWLYGRFNEFDGSFSFDEAAPEKASVTATIKTASVDTNHAERDKHLRSSDFLDVEKFPEATFKSTSYDGKETLVGDLTLNGVTKPVTLTVTQIGAGKDPWGGYRRGFEGTTKFKMADFGITKNLGPASTHVEMTLSVEGIKK